MALLGFVGGTGPLGRGLALRFALAGHSCLIGSRDAGRASEAVGKVQGKVEGRLDVRPAENGESAAECEIAVVTLPFDTQAETLGPLQDALAGKIVISTANPLLFDDGGPCPARPDVGSAAEACQLALPRSSVVGAFHNVSAVALSRPAHPLDSDVLVMGDDEGARGAVVRLVAGIPGLRPVEAGPLRLARAVEDFTAAMIAVNMRHRTHTGLRLTGLLDPPDAGAGQP